MKEVIVQTIGFLIWIGACYAWYKTGYKRGYQDRINQQLKDIV